MPFKINISHKGKTYKLETESEVVVGKTIGETINIGSNFEITIADTLNLIKNLMGSDIKFITDEHSGRILVDKELAEEENEKMSKLFTSI